MPCTASPCWLADVMRPVQKTLAAAVAYAPRLLSAIAVVAVLAANAWLVVTLSMTSAAWAQAQAPEEAPEDYPAGKGRDQTFYTCTACHGFKLVAAQAMNRRQWDDSINLMISKHGMPVLEDKDREAVLNYLESAFPPRSVPGRGFQNPFIK